MRKTTAEAQPAPLDAPGNVGDVRKANLARVLAVIAGAHSEHRLSRADIATRSKLTKASVSSLVADLLASGLVIEIGVHRDGERGRPSVGLILNPARCVIGMEINVDYISAGLVDLSGKLLTHQIVPRLNRGVNAEQVIDALSELSSQMQQAAEAQDLKILGGGLAVPGLVDEKSYTVLQAPNLGWETQSLNVRKLLRETKSRFRLFNEANASALAQQQLMGPAERDFLFVSGEVGIGGGLIIDAELFAGPQGHAGELGHVVVQPEGKPCSCGGRGCLETVAGQEAILSAANLGVAARGASRQQRIERLYQALESGQESASIAVADAGKSLGVAVASAMRLFNVSTVVFGGHFAALEQWLLPATTHSLTTHAPSIASQAQLRFSPLGQTGALIGAAHSVVGDLLESPHQLVG
ncbi:ROK family transcriptional regulator [Arthrobacter sp. MYb213]|uniref:ROK family transcriptional regulator n=1 Tax=Arthrobacter sp. MYb213 TaxID=1848595 RepID=UPI000CFADB72|nr:ROK family transcriptional regulator [Arthrobacter sp. MYb213]PRB69282.1 MarR family transcriptional regulator [Arthrobacter sp. MYb213]